MRDFFKNPLVARVVGALGAGATAWFTTGNLKAAGATALTFLVYGVSHTAAQDGDANAAR